MKREIEKYLKPLKGLIVRFPSTMVVLPEKGAMVPWIGKEGTYWRRRVKDGSCIFSKPPEKEIKKIEPVPVVEDNRKMTRDKDGGK